MRLRAHTRLDLFFVPLLIALVLLSGCGDGRPARVPVSGKVLIDGKPLTYGIVEFIPPGGRMASGALDANGAFALTCYTEQDGALIGKHYIQIHADERVSDVVTRVHAPRKYASLDTSGLSEDIQNPTDSIVINLTWQGSGHNGPYAETSATSASDEPSLVKRFSERASKAN